MPAGREPFPVSGGRLAARLDPTPKLNEEFRGACRALLESDAPELTVDLGAARRISSANMSYLVTLHYDARDRGKRLTVLISDALMDTFRRTHLVDLVGMDIRGPGGKRPGPEKTG